MQEFFMDYGLWLLVGLLVIIGLVFLLSGKGKTADAAPPSVEQAAPVAIVEALPVAPLVAAPMVPIIDLASVPLPDIQPIAAPVSDDLLRIKGVGPKLSALLVGLGITRFDQIAAWTDSDIAMIDPKLGNFKGRPIRDQWVDQAKYLAAGDIAGFEAKYGKL